MYVYKCVYKYMYVYIYIYTHTCVYMYICIYVHTYVYIYIYMHIYTYVCIYVYIYIYIYVCLRGSMGGARLRVFRVVIHDLSRKANTAYVIISTITISTVTIIITIYHQSISTRLLIGNQRGV